MQTRDGHGGWPTSSPRFTGHEITTSTLAELSTTARTWLERCFRRCLTLTLFLCWGKFGLGIIHENDGSVLIHDSGDTRSLPRFLVDVIKVERFTAYSA